MKLVDELRRRNVFRVAAAYIAVAWLVIQIVETLFPQFGLGEFAARAVVIVLIIGFFPAIVLSWVFELTPEGFRRDAEFDHTTPGAIAMGKRLDRFIIVVLVLAVGYFAVDKFLIDPARDAAIREQAREEGRSEALVGAYGDKSIAVLPFADLSPARDQAYFGEGLAEELLNLLAQVREVRVISRSSAFSIATEDLEAPEIAKWLRVAHVLERSVRLSGNRIRVTAQLIDAPSDTHLWSGTYDRDLGDVFDIQDEIAAQIVEQLEVELLSGMPKSQRAASPEVLKLVLRAQHLARSDTRAIVAQQALLEEALAIDADYVPALIGLANVHWELAARPGKDREAHTTRLLHLTARAASIAPDHPEVMAGVGWDAFEYEGNLEFAAGKIERAIEAAPSNALVLAVGAAFAERIGAWDAVVALRERAISVDPLCFSCIGMLVRAYANAGRLDEAMAAWEDYARLVPGQRHWTKATLHLLRGEPAEALATFEGPGINDHWRHAGRAMALAELGRIDEARAALERQKQEYGEAFPTGVATGYAWLGDYDAAFDELERILEERGSSEIVRRMNHPDWQPLRSHPRWAEIGARIGLSPDRVAELEFDPDLPAQRTARQVGG